MPTLTVVADCGTKHLYGLLATAAAAQGVETRAVDARRSPATASPPCQPGDALYRAAVSGAAIEIEALLWRPGVATFHARDGGPLRVPVSAAALFAQHSVPTPRRIVCPTAAPDGVLAAVDEVGGLPVVVRTEGSEGGRGVMVAESTRSVLSLVDHLVDQGFAPTIEELVDGAHWRLVVVGASIAAAYLNPVRPGDFRSHAVDDPSCYTEPPPERAVAAAIAATAALGFEFGGVDALVSPDGTATVLEVNFPCYFAQAEDAVGVPVAAAMVAHLVEKAARWAT